MTKRERLHKRKAILEQRIAQLNQNLIDLKGEIMMICDDVSQYKEQEEEFIVKRRSKIIEKRMVGRIHFKQPFKDEADGSIFFIERCPIVRVNGEWCSDITDL